MTTTLHRPSNAKANGYSPASFKRRVQLPFLGLALLLIALGAIIFGLFASSSATRQRVLVATRSIPPGEVIGADDIAVVEISTGSRDGLVPESDRSRVVGQRAAVGIPTGAFLAPGSTRSGGAVDPGSAIVAIILAPGTAPVADLRTGDRVQIIGTASSATSGSASVLAEGDVVAVNPIKSGPTTSGSLSVSVRVPETNSAAVASASAADKVRLVLVGPGG